jgi:hypothetical protein
MRDLRASMQGNNWVSDPSSPWFFPCMIDFYFVNVFGICSFLRRFFFCRLSMDSKGHWDGRAGVCIFYSWFFLCCMFHMYTWIRYAHLFKGLIKRYLQHEWAFPPTTTRFLTGIVSPEVIATTTIVGNISAVPMWCDYIACQLICCSWVSSRSNCISTNKLYFYN